MSTSQRDSIGSRLRPIEIALDNFKSRMQGSFSSQLSNLKSKVEYINFKLTPSIGKTGAPQPSGVDLRAVIEEIKSLVQKDLLQDTSRLINEKLSEFQGLVLQIKNVMAEASSGRTQPTGQQQEIFLQPHTDGPEADLSIGSGQKDSEIASLREEINRLYNLTEREPRFQPFWILRDAYPSWLQITKMARTLNETPSNVHENLKTFEQLGLVEIKEGEARATKLVRPNKPTTNR